MSDILESIQRRRGGDKCAAHTDCYTSDIAALLAVVREQQTRLDRATVLIGELADPDWCSFDHHGGCQTHGYLSLEPGETCPQHDAKNWEPTP